MSNTPPALAAVIRGIPGLGVAEERLRANTVPVLNIIGERDGFLPDVKALHESMARHRLLVLPGMTHGNAGAVERFLPELIGFLESITPRPVA